ncbi:adenosine deaminase [Streptomyces sp. NPDC127068]|uniref:adenosine deaminase family protein n=1 Tax=Streptomyces sp. NPDC127068 TaxID=3347127 RepID=UPI00365B0EB4
MMLQRCTAIRRVLPVVMAVLSLWFPSPALAAEPTPVTASLADGSLLPTASAPRPATAAEARTDAYLWWVRQNPDRVRDFFLRLPKGGDLHNHLSGAVSTEYLIRLAAEDGLCIDATLTAVAPPCGAGTRPATDALTDRDFREALLRAWSMQDFSPDGNGHDHFFDTFSKFGEVTWRHRGKLLAEFADVVVRQNQSYLETMVTPASGEAKRLAAEVGWDDDLAALHRKLLVDGKLDALVTRARQEADDADVEFHAEARCGTDRPRPACRLMVRWISQVSRASSPERVFTQIALGMRLAEQDRRFVAINLVQPEDHAASLRDYRLQMRMIRYLRERYPRAHITLHAGELWPGLVKPEDLSFHIKEAVEVARAERIGHGVDLLHEDNWQGTVRTMAAREIAVEVPFTSNAQILGVHGAEHPFETYRAHRVPVVLATDDPGVSRIDISHEYRYAADTYALAYPELKDLSRASLEYAFLPGASLWRGNPTTDGYRLDNACRGERPGTRIRSPECHHLMTESPKAQLQWRQEASFATFEQSHTMRVR